MMEENQKQPPLTEEQYKGYALRIQTCEKCQARFICRGSDKVWVPAIGPKFNEAGIMINQNTTLAQRACRPHGDDSCINPDKTVEGGKPWDTQLEETPSYLRNFSDNTQI